MRLAALRLCLKGVWVLSGWAGKLERDPSERDYFDRYGREPGIRG